MKDERIEIEAIIAGQTGRYRSLVERYQNPVFRVIYKIVNDYQEAGELTQDVFVKAYESLNQYNPEYKFFSWIYRMAINRALLHLRNRKPYVELDKIPSRENVMDETASYDVITKKSLVDKAVNELNESYRMVIQLKYYADLSYAEMAEVLGIPEKTIKSRLFDARMILKDKIGNNLKYVE